MLAAINNRFLAAKILLDEKYGALVDCTDPIQGRLQGSTPLHHFTFK